LVEVSPIGTKERGEVPVSILFYSSTADSWGRNMGSFCRLGARLYRCGPFFLFFFVQNVDISNRIVVSFSFFSFK